MILFNTCCIYYIIHFLIAVGFNCFVALKIWNNNFFHVILFSSRFLALTLLIHTTYSPIFYFDLHKLNKKYKQQVYLSFDALYDDINYQKIGNRKYTEYYFYVKIDNKKYLSEQYEDKVHQLKNIGRF